MKTSEYTFTGFMPSGNPFSWYYDENKHTAFTTSIEVSTWDKEPKKGDKIKMIKSGHYNEVLEQVFINDHQVYQRSAEKEKQKHETSDAIYDNLKREKGFI